jgi:hypothetical protein
METVAGMPDFGSAGVAPLLSHTTARSDELARRYKARPQDGRQADREPAHRTSRRYGTPQTPTQILNQADVVALYGLCAYGSRANLEAA